ncbi:hypothetical protein AB6A40_003751 [Gnathostoma spinigerum]|uniref:Uncharacterized protein n=1 Tax=Gnathostoma spinigerum TaxID=75299 RepID=A0ABD6EK23_9BILA
MGDEWASCAGNLSGLRGKFLWNFGPPPHVSCYSALRASTSSDSRSLRHRSCDERLSVDKFCYDMDFDLRTIKDALKPSDFLEDSGYQSLLERSRHAQYGTGWLIQENISDDGSDSVDASWDGYMDVGDQRIKVKEMSDILASRFAFISGWFIIFTVFCLVHPTLLFSSSPPLIFDSSSV